MSLHYEWTLSLRLRPDVPEAFLDELRYHLGLSDLVPSAPTLDWDGPALAGAGGEALPGGPVATLIRQQPHLNGPWVRGMFARVFVRADAMYELMQTVPPWLAVWSLTEGWIGFAREELDLDPWLNFYAMQGHAYAAAPGAAPQPLGQGAPSFTPTETTERWALPGMPGQIKPVLSNGPCRLYSAQIPCLSGGRRRSLSSLCSFSGILLEHLP
jgi:hypothetical protein